jgi:hypothetical protein
MGGSRKKGSGKRERKQRRKKWRVTSGEWRARGTARNDAGEKFENRNSEEEMVPSSCGEDDW